MSVHSANGFAAIGDDGEESSFNSNQDCYEALIIGGVWPDKEHAVELGLGCSGIGLWFRCEGAFLWDQCGSLMRSVLMTIHRYSSIQNIYVVAEGACGSGSKEGTLVGSSPIVLGAGVPRDSMRTLNYLLRHVHGVDPNVWLGACSDPASAVLNSVRLLRDHPLMPESMRVQGFLIEEMGTRLLSLNF